MKTIVILICAVLSMLAFTATDTNAQSGNYVCTVIQAGATGTTSTGGGRVVLTDSGNAFSNKAFKLPVERTKVFLAVALSAMLNDKKVKVKIDEQMVNVLSIYLVND